MKKGIKLFSLIIFLISAFLLVMQNVTYINADEVYPFHGVIHADSLVVHNAPNTNSSSAVTQLVYGSRVEVLGISGSTYLIKYDGDKTGYVSNKYVTNIDTNTLTKDATGVETYDVYCNSLVTAGFDKTYCPYLYYLHSVHPKWTFKVNYVDYTLDEASKQEEEKVSLQTGNPNYWIYVNGEPLINEANYYFITASTITSFMDPRNSLFEKTIFQFLNLEKNTDAINDAALASVSGASGNLRQYTAEFIEAANSLNINALHLMARSKQEGANTVGYSAVSGTFTTTKGISNPDGKTLDGFFNFYNIGSYKDSKNGYNSTIQRGLAYAAGYIGGTSYDRPWDTPEKAIVGGGQWIGEQYVKSGQNTNYFQKFNVSNTSTSKIFTHQYMTNAYAAASEAGTIKNAYVAGNLLNTGFEFIIPVYKDMPSDEYQAVDKNSNAGLSTITIDDKVITGFDADVVEYNYNAVTEANTIKVGAKTLVSTSSVEGTGDYEFKDGKVKVTLKVTAESGATRTYIVNVTKVNPADNITVEQIVSKMGVKTNDKYMYGISPETSITTLINTVTKNKGTATVTDANGKSKSSGSFVTGDKMTIKGTNDSKTFTIAVRGDINGDGLVKINDLILIQSHILEKTKLTDEKFYAADINYDSNIKINDLILVQSHILEKSSL